MTNKPLANELFTKIGDVSAENSRLRVKLSRIQKSASDGLILGSSEGAIKWRDALEKIEATARS